MKSEVLPCVKCFPFLSELRCHGRCGSPFAWISPSLPTLERRNEAMLEAGCSGGPHGMDMENGIGPLTKGSVGTVL